MIYMTDRDQIRCEQLYKSYKQMYENPQNCDPKIIVHFPGEDRANVIECFDDAGVMLRHNLSSLPGHMEICDDWVPAIRVEFGTGQIASAFGCDTYFRPDSPMCAKNHVLHDISEARDLPDPDLRAGWFGRLEEFTHYFMQHLPEGVHVQIPDMQSPFNSAHLIRGNDILTDFYDDPEAVDCLLTKVTDYMIRLTSWLRAMFDPEPGWFFDYGAMWKGAARLSDCSLHMISPQMYAQHIRKHDIRYLHEIGGGRIHYCGSPKEVIRELVEIPESCGLDLDGSLHDAWEVSEYTPPEHALMFSLSDVDGFIAKVRAHGGLPRRNLMLVTWAGSKAEAARITNALRAIF